MATYIDPDIITPTTSPDVPTIPAVSLGVDPSGGTGAGTVDFSSIPFDGLWNFISSLWSLYTILAYIFSIILLVLYVYASVKKNLYLGLQIQKLRDDEKLYAEQFRGEHRASRLDDVLKHSDSDNPNDWKLAIIEADIILDDVLKQRGYIGSSLGERLKSISSSQLSSLDDAWEAHKVRNRIAHDGADFVLTKRLAHETIGRYQRVFNEFGVT
ncbi:MAG: hypothetical protein KC877_00905 [Candidatus Kaiserbacteria bacterium]|nr:hypothetical protein [Candidatus Kaiserbacteria bacterium]MCB9816818.1 hypothetical protein [Candidatus Nomurabacteria bacterium]